MVNRGNLVDQNVFVGRIEVNSFLDDGLIVIVQTNAAAFEGAGASKAAGFNFEPGRRCREPRTMPLLQRLNSLNF